MPIARGVTFEILGLQGFRAALERTSTEIRQRCAVAMEESAVAVQQAAKVNLHDDGDLNRAIIVTGRGLSWRVGISDEVFPGRGGDRIHQRPFIYGYIREVGNQRQPPRPFMRPARDAEESRFVQRIHLTGLVF